MASSSPITAASPLLTTCSPSQESLTGSENEDAFRENSEQCLVRTQTPDSDTREGEPISSSITLRLYISHFLSTWNSRVFEFGAVLYLANIYPGTLLPMSLYALVRGASAILLSPAVGRYIDVGNRLTVVRLSIVLQRVVVSLSCATFWILSQGEKESRFEGWIKSGLLALLALLACVEKLCSIMNLVSIEKDWVVVIAQSNESNLRELNSQMRRIDLTCKLAGPFVIAMLNGISTEISILVNLGMNVASILVEYYAIAKVYSMVPTLQIPKASASNGRSQRMASGCMPTGFSHNIQHLKDTFKANILPIVFYVRHTAFLPSFACSLLYFTVLSFSGQMITYLLSVGYTSFHIGIARTISVAFEISATWLAPLVMTRIGPIRSGIWFINWQLICLTGAASIFWGSKFPILAASGLVGGMILSRVGLWGFDLSAQIIIQEEVEDDQRGSFSAVEASVQNMFELCSFVTTIIFSQPDDFQWPVLMSCIAVATAASLYAGFVRSRRGHLLHWSRCFSPNENKRQSHRAYERLL